MLSTQLVITWQAVVGNATTSLVYLLAFLAVITLVVFVHELGHFLAGRWCGVLIERFSVGFGPELFGLTDRRGTRWSFSALPLGGYVKFAGDTNVASVPTEGAAEPAAPPRGTGRGTSVPAAGPKPTGATAETAVDAASHPDHLFNRPTWQRAIVIAAGPFASLLLAVVIFAGLALAYGVRITAPAIGQAVPNSPAAAAGFKPGDIVKSIDGQSLRSFQEIAQVVATSGGGTLIVVVERDGKPVKLAVTPRLERMYGGVPLIPGPDGASLAVTHAVERTAAGKAGLRGGDVVRVVDGARVKSIADLPRLVTLDDGHHVFGVDRQGTATQIRFKPGPGEDDFRRSHGVWRIGVTPSPTNVVERVGFFGAIGHGIERTVFIVRATVSYARDVFSGTQSADQIGGIGHMVDVAGTVARKYSVLDLIPLAAMISASVGLMNLLPFLPLDGGHLFNHAVEAVRGRPLSLRSQELQALFGLSLVAGLFFLAFFNDLTVYHRWIFG